MKTLIVLSIAAAVSIPVSWERPSGTPAGSAAGPGAILTMHHKICEALDSGKPDDLKEWVLDDKDFRLFLHSDFFALGDERPSGGGVSVEGFQKGFEVLAAMCREGSVPGATWTTKVHSEHADCHSAELGYGTLMLTRSMTKDGLTVSQEFRSTVLARYRDGKFRLLHWHLSPEGARWTEKTGAPKKDEEAR